MKLSKAYHIKHLFAALAGVFLFSACNIDGLDSDTGELTDEEIRVASQIIGESLSAESDGIFSSLNDAFVIPNQSEFNESFSTTSGDGFLLRSLATANNDESTQGTSNENNYSYEYDPETGTHSVSFSRSINRPEFSKESSADLEYIFYDVTGGFVDSPRMDNDRIETVDYTASRSGSITTPRKSSSYQRSDQFLTDGLSLESGTIQIDGLHQGSGQFESAGENGGTVSRNYEISVDFLNVRIDKELMERSNSLERGVTGSVAYEMVINRNVNGEESTKTVNGTIELNGDGTALLRFRDVLDIFRIKLDDGTVFEDDEFEGYVRSVNTAAQSFTLYSGQTIFITDRTEVEYDDGLTSFEDVERAVRNGFRVEAEGDVFRRDDGTYEATEVEFEIEDDDLEFEGLVESVNLSEQSFTLRSGLTLIITDRSEIDRDGDLFSLQEVADAIERGFEIEADGEFYPESDDRLIVLEVEFEYENNDFDEIITSVNTTDGSFTLRDGNTYYLTDDSRIDEDSDLFTAEHIEIALNNNLRIEADGEYLPDENGRFIVTEVEFEFEDAEFEFDEDVMSVDLENRTFTLENGVVFTINDQTRFDSDGDFFTLESVAQAIENNREVEAEGKYLVLPDNSLLVTIVEFELD